MEIFVRAPLRCMQGARSLIRPGSGLRANDRMRLSRIFSQHHLCLTHAPRPPRRPRRGPLLSRISTTGVAEDCCARSSPATDVCTRPFRDRLSTSGSRHALRAEPGRPLFFDAFLAHVAPPAFVRVHEVLVQAVAPWVWCAPACPARADSAVNRHFAHEPSRAPIRGTDVPVPVRSNAGLDGSWPLPICGPARVSTSRAETGNPNGPRNGTFSVS